MSEPQKSPTLRDRLHLFSRATSETVGYVWAFLLAVGTVVVLGLTGPFSHYSDTWQLVINPSTTIVTFIIVFSSKAPRTVMPRPCISSSTN